MKRGDKVAYVTDAPQTREHHCHWPGCDKQVPPAMWGCSKHWFTLPVALRRRIWAAFEPGQEETMTPSPKYIEAAQDVQNWIRDHFGADVAPSTRAAARSAPAESVAGQEKPIEGS